MITLLLNLGSELTLIATACLLLVLGSLGGKSGRRVAPVLAAIALIVATGYQVSQFGHSLDDKAFTNVLGGGVMAQFVRIIAGVAGLLFVLLAWPTRPDGNNGALAVGAESSEYFALLLLSISGLMLSAGANSMILLFLGLELASIPTYIMVSISRPLPIAQEAGVKYFFLGALSAALMLLGFSYIYGVTGTVSLSGNGPTLEYRGVFEYVSALQKAVPAGGAVGGGDAAGEWPALLLLGVVVLLAGFAFKMAAFPLHVYAADVYQGAASPLTALLSVVPKAAGLTAIIKMLIALGGASGVLPHRIVLLVAVLAVLTMSVGNVLALLQYNVKRVMAYSSVAHSGYMLAGVAAMLAAGRAGNAPLAEAALAATLFYLATYAVMNTGVFAVLQQLPAKPRYADDHTPDQLLVRGAASAETFEDLGGHGRAHPYLGVAMFVCALSLVGIPFTAGFLGKVLVARPLIEAGMIWLVVAMMINAAVSSAYYLRLPGSMFFRSLPDRPASDAGSAPAPRGLASLPASLAAGLCVLGVLVLGVVLPVSSRLSALSTQAAASALRGDNAGSSTVAP